MSDPGKRFCVFCDQPALYFCDHRIGRQWSIAELLGSFQLFQFPVDFTCDLPLCERHHSHRKRQDLSSNRIIFADICPLHVEADEPVPTISTEDADSIRVQLFADARRSAMR